jgi:hypothetical protein
MAELRVQLLNGQHHRDAARVTLFCHVLQPAKSRQLVAKFMSDRDDPRVAIRLSEFLALVWRLANDKARELGWGWVV